MSLIKIVSHTNYWDQSWYQKVYGFFFSYPWKSIEIEKDGRIRYYSGVEDVENLNLTKWYFAKVNAVEWEQEWLPRLLRPLYGRPTLFDSNLDHQEIMVILGDGSVIYDERYNWKSCIVQNEDVKWLVDRMFELFDYVFPR
jgi:hypothetical protein